MFNTRNVIKIITTTNEITTGKIGLKKIKKYPNLKRNNSNYKPVDKQTIFCEDSQKLNELFDLFIQESKCYIDSSFIFNVDPILDEKINDEIRDKEIGKLLDLNKVYFGLPISVICDTVSIIDRFISKVKVKPKYMPCLAAACLHFVATSKGHDKIFLTCDNLANLHRCGASGQDLERMQQIIIKKLQNSMPLVTIYNFIELIDPQAIDDHKFVRILEVALTKFAIFWHRPSRVAVACLIAYYQQNQDIQQISMFQQICDAIKEDWDLIKYLSILISDQYSIINSKRSIESSRNHLLWVISRKSLSNFQTASPPLLETISEEIDGSFNLN